MIRTRIQEAAYGVLFRAIYWGGLLINLPFYWLEDVEDRLEGRKHDRANQSK